MSDGLVQLTFYTLHDALTTPPVMGRPRRGDRKVFTQGDLENAGRIIAYRAPVPPPCVCGSDQYWFYVDASRGRLIAECRLCKYKRVWSVAGNGWGPFG